MRIAELKGQVHPLLSAGIACPRMQHIDSISCPFHEPFISPSKYSAFSNGGGALILCNMAR